MGIAEFNQQTVTIHSHIITYGNAATPEVTEQIRQEIEDMWNEPRGVIHLDGRTVSVRFLITAELRKGITELEVLQNTDPNNNYFRIEEYAAGNISFVDGLGSNTGYFKLDNLYPGSTTAAHEYGHSLGLDHPTDLDIRGQGVPGIMYPRGTLVDPEYQYEPLAIPGGQGGTMHPKNRRVRQKDIDLLQLNKLLRYQNPVIVGQFTNIYQWDNRQDHDNSLHNLPID
jgi:hypothetical protein